MTQTILGNILHPEYSYMSQRWREWRLCYESGQFYIENYLLWFEHESHENYNLRKELTYVPAHAKEAVNEVRNAVWGRLCDVARHDGPQTYQDCVKGLNGGVDRQRNPMSHFIGKTILPEMLTMRRVGVWIDAPKLPDGASMLQAKGKKPYLVWYPVESIRSWATDDSGKLTRILLKQSNFLHDEATGLPMSGNVDAFRYAWIGEEDKGQDPTKVYVREETDVSHGQVRQYVLDLPEIPYVQFEIEHSLLEDICRHQRALMQMESSDVFWCCNANFPIWTQQIDTRASPTAARPAKQQATPPSPRRNSDDNPPGVPVKPAVPAGQAKEASNAKPLEATIGPTTGIGYPMGLERPDFVAPPSDPLKASMAKEMQVKEDIRRLVHLSVASLDPRMASAESKEMDDRGLQAGLVAIGAALERGEREIAYHWANYYKAEAAQVKYPSEWSMQSDVDRRKEAKDLIEVRDEVPSITFRKEVAKQIARKCVGHKVSNDVMDKIEGEVDEAPYVSANVEDVTQDIQNRTLSAALASTIRGYPEGESEKALKEQAHQLSIMAIAQSPAGGVGAAARGLPSHPSDKSSKNEKEMAAKASGVPKDNTRGKGQFAEGEPEPLKDKGHSPIVSND